MILLNTTASEVLSLMAYSWKRWFCLLKTTPRQKYDLPHNNFFHRYTNSNGISLWVKEQPPDVMNLDKHNFIGIVLKLCSINLLILYLFIYWESSRAHKMLFNMCLGYAEQILRCWVIVFLGQVTTLLRRFNSSWNSWNITKGLNRGRIRQASK